MKHRFALLFLMNILIVNVFFVSIESVLSNGSFTYLPPNFFDHGDYSSNEQYMLELHNRARKDPIAESARLGIDLQEGLDYNLTAKPPLAMNKELCITTDEYSETMYIYGTLSHSVDGTTYYERMTANNYTGSPRGETVAQFLNFEYLYRQIMESVPHREMLLSIPHLSTEIGIGHYIGPSMDYANILYGISNISYILGVVYNDTNGNSFYDIGEGLENIHIIPDSGDYYTTTGISGGYSLPITVNATMRIHVVSNTGNISIVKTLNVSSIGDNIKLDFVISEFNQTTTMPTTSSVTTTLDPNSSGETLTSWVTHTTWVTNTKETVDFISLTIISIACIVYVVRRKKK